MKYTTSNKPLVCMQTQSTCYQGTRKMTIKGVLWHSTGANNPTLKRYVQPSDTKPPADTYNKTRWLEILGKNPYSNDWNHIYREAGLNCWIGKLEDGTVTTVQTMPWEYRPWGCGSGSKGSCNDGWIQFEICEDSLTDKTYFNKIYQEACEITAYLCKMFNIDPNGTVVHNGVNVPTILCHQDSYQLGLGGNHGDVYHWFSKHGKDMSTVRTDVAKLLKATNSSSAGSSSTTTVKTYKVITPINRYSSADDAVNQKNAKSDKLAAGTYYIYNKYPNGINGVFNISTDKTGASAGSWINPKENVIKESTTVASVKTYKVVTPINRYTSAGDAKAQTNAKAEKLNAGTYYIYNKYPNGLDGMYNISTDKAGASAGSWINPKENVVKENTTTTTAQKLYRVRKSKDDAASQKGAFSDIDNAKDCCQTAGAGYHVFDWDYKIVYSYKAPTAAAPSAPETQTPPTVDTNPIALTSIKITSKPTTLEYFIGDRKIDRTGLVVTATYSDKSTKTVTNFNISGFDTSKVGTITVKVALEGKSDTFDVVIKEKEVTPPMTEPEVVEPVKVYELDYPEKTKIVDKSIKRTESDCVKAIKKILSNNKDFDIEIAKAFFELAPKYNIDPMMAIAQSILETGWFKYVGSAVTTDQHNYCGLGVTSNGVKGAAFDTVKDGVTAQLQHLFAYGCKDALASGEKVLDPRFNLVTRGVATYWQQLAGRWACPGYDTKTYDTPQKAMEAGNTYGQKILALCNILKAETILADDLEKYFPNKKEEPIKPEEPTETMKPSEPEPEPEPEEPEVTVPETTVPEPQIPESEITSPEAESPEMEEPDESIEAEDEPESAGDLDINTRANSLAELIFKCIKKLIKMIAETFSKGE